eukprot:TRINITY_DN8361_c0_g1_i7.p1 TRINITY_DN8361_c0_g1~~TRINITY_DN8361_c0_g1_i7.p1  ORF type:complete len:1024 (+),score=243.16 TRINITY_DN8361_c0_g1_i7:93-3164(+)
MCIRDSKYIDPNELPVYTMAQLEEQMWRAGYCDCSSVSALEQFIAEHDASSPRLNRRNSELESTSRSRSASYVGSLTSDPGGLSGSYQARPAISLREQPAFEPGPNDIPLASLKVFQKMACYFREFLARPSAHVGRPGPVCPFVPRALQQQSLYLAVVSTKGFNSQATIQGVVEGMVDRFLSLSPQQAPGKFVKAVVLCFPDVPVSAAPQLIDGVQFALKHEFVAKGLMLGEFHMANNCSGLRNSSFFPLRTPVPCLAIRYMVPTDIVFMTKSGYPAQKRLEFLSSYIAEQKDSLEPDELAEATSELRKAKVELGLPLEGPRFMGAMLTIQTYELFDKTVDFYKSVLQLTEFERSGTSVVFQIADAVYVNVKHGPPQHGTQISLLSDDLATVRASLTAVSVSIDTLSPDSISFADPAGTTVYVRQLQPKPDDAPSDLSAIRARLGEVGLSKDAPQVLVFYGSHTGTAEGLAKTFAAELVTSGTATAKAVPLSSWSAEDLWPVCSLAVFIVATHGIGGPTKTAQTFKAWLTSVEGQSDLLAGRTAAVFGLGNSSYTASFNGMGRSTVKELEGLGVDLVYEYGEGDANSEVVIGGSTEDDFEAWRKGFEPKLRELFPKHGISSVPCAQPLEFIYSVLSEPSESTEQDERMTVAAKRRLRKDETDGVTFHMEFELPEQHREEYVAACCMDIWPMCNPFLVNRMCDILIPGSSDEFFTLIPTSDDQAPPFPVPSSLRTVLTSYIDLHALPKRSLLKDLAAHAPCPPEKAALLQLASEYNPSSLGTVVDLLEQFGSCRPPIGTLLQMLPAIAARSYTVSSSPKLSPDRVHITFNRHDFSNNSMEMTGLCTEYLASVIAPNTVRARLAPSSFQELLTAVPALDPPMILVAAGTGLAPMRALLQERRQNGPLDNMHLVFGCCHQTRDFIYHDELCEMEKAGLRLTTAFSRQTENKVYVQDKLREDASAVFESMHAQNGYLVVCGGTAMGSAIQAVLVECGVACGGMSAEASAAWVDSLLESGHYVQELWS